MDVADFVQTRRERWAELEALLARAEGAGPTSLSVAEVQRLSRLYRAASSDLLWVRARAAPAEVTEYVNALVGRAYTVTYPGQRFEWRRVLSFVAFEVPALFLREWRMVAAAAVVFFAGSIFGAVGVMADSEGQRYLVPEMHAGTDPAARAEHESDAPVAPADQQAAFAAFLFTHNIEVAFLAFALGLTLGIGTVLLMFTNGIMLGSLAQVYAAKGLSGWFWAWILPHGIPELTAIFIGGGAGLMLARGVVAAAPGMSRRASLRREARSAVQLLLGSLLIFVLAGLIEGTISQIHPPKLSVEFKIGFALLVGAAVYAYLLSAAWRRRPA